MHPLHVAVALSTLACAACAGGIFVHARRGSGEDLRRAVLLLGFAYLGVCQLMAHLQPSPEAAAWLARASAPGWVFLGPLALQVFSERFHVRARWLSAPLRLGYGLAFVALVAAVTTPWVVASMRPAPWGYSIEPGPLYGPIFVYNLLGTLIGVGIAGRATGELPEDRRRPARWLLAGVSVPTAILVGTDFVMPLAGREFPPLIPSVFAPVALLSLYLHARFGQSPLTPSRAAEEILASLPDGVALHRSDGRIRFANPALARLAGTSVEALEGKPMDALLQPGDAHDRFELIFGDGPRIPVAARSHTLHTERGIQLGEVTVVRDLREVSDLRHQLLTSARLAAVGELAAGIAHEINNPLAFVRSNLSQLEARWKQLRDRRRDLGPEFASAFSDTGELLEESLEGIDRAVEIVRSVNRFAHSGSDARESVDVRQLLEDSLRIASIQLRDRVEVWSEFESDLPPVRGAAQQLRQVFLNLVVNAAQAVDDGGTVFLATRVEQDEVVVAVADDGCGIPRDVVDRIFDPFFTTKAVGVGTGLGLGIAHRIVESHGGTIEVETADGRGSVFRVRLPVDHAS
ncbi:MAG: ATP-binding protein [Myxococcota bacterium]